MHRLALLLFCVAFGCATPLGSAPEDWVGLTEQDEVVDRIRFVVPAGREGAFVLRESPDGGAWRRVGDSFVVNVPKSGVVLLETLQPIRDWHQSSAQFSDGTPIDNEFVSDAMKLQNDNVARFYSCWTNQDGDTFYMVGRRKDVKLTYTLRMIAPGLRGK